MQRSIDCGFQFILWLIVLPTEKQARHRLGVRLFFLNMRYRTALLDFLLLGFQRCDLRREILAGGIAGGEKCEQPLPFFRCACAHKFGEYGAQVGQLGDCPHLLFF